MCEATRQTTMRPQNASVTTHVGHTGPGDGLGEISDPQPVGPLGGEDPLDEIGGPVSFGVRAGGPHLL